LFGLSLAIRTRSEEHPTKEVFFDLKLSTASPTFAKAHRPALELLGKKKNIKRKVVWCPLFLL
jgi:hypothetical protein